VLLAGYATLWLTAPRHRITAKNIEAIQEAGARGGITKGKIEEIFGVPAGNYSSGNDDEVNVEFGCMMIPSSIEFGCMMIKSPIKDMETGFTIWLGDEGGLWGTFDQPKTR
jgi:hypothetical protein